MALLLYLQVERAVVQFMYFHSRHCDKHAVGFPSSMWKVPSMSKDVCFSIVYR